jgi:perosamine synthetase
MSAFRYRPCGQRFSDGFAVPLEVVVDGRVFATESQLETVRVCLDSKISNRLNDIRELQNNAGQEAHRPMKDGLLQVAAPMFVGNERAYVLDCLDSTWISSTGQYIDRFEAAFAEFCGVRHAVCCNNGTTALHLVLDALGIGPGDEVIVPTLTFVATANAVRYCGGTPVFADVRPESWTIDPDQLEALITPRTKGIIVVHLFGHPADVGAVQEIADRYGLFLVEDAAQSPGAEYRGRRVGSMGRLSTFSFFGNKIISTGEGGMVTTDDDTLASRVRILKSQGMDPARRYWFEVVGYNYRMTNVAAAMGLGQLETIQWHLQRRQEVAAWYRERLQGVPGLSWQVEQDWAHHVWWMFTVVLDDRLPVHRDEVMARLLEQGIETRRVPYPLHQLPIYQEATAGQSFPAADHIAGRGINLPTWSKVTREDVDRICEVLLEALRPTSVALGA